MERKVNIMKFSILILKKHFKRYVIPLVVVCAISVICLFIHTSKAYSESAKQSCDFQTVLDTYTDTVGYSEYLEALDEDCKIRPSDNYVINATDYVRTDGMAAKTYVDYDGESGTSVYTDESGLIEYQVDIKTAGLYDLSLRYYPIEGNDTTIQRSFLIDSEIPYSQLNCIEFSRVWRNESNVWEQDNQGNDLRPKQIEVPKWMDGYCYDSNGYVTDKLSVYLSKGVHSITIVSVREPLLIRSITLGNSEDPLNYKAKKAELDAQGVLDSSGQMITIEAENADLKSSQMLYPVQDQSTPAVSPYSAKCLLNNTIGGTSWQDAGEWIEWNFKVPEDGYYQISMHDNQNFVQGIPVSRKITIDGEVPFEEFTAYKFNYDGDWRMETLTEDSDGKPYKIHLTKGNHTIRMEVVLGDLASITDRVEDVLQQLNMIYRKIIRITGVSPDSYRDYELTTAVAGTDEELAEVSENLTAIIKDLRAITGKGGEKERVLVTMRDQLDELSNDLEKFPKVLDSYKTNISALGTWIGDVEVQPLQIDTIYIYSPGQDTPTLNDGILHKFLHEAKKLYYSFVIDYNIIGNVSDKEEERTVTVWIGSGRDQANVLKSLADESFTYNTGINANVMLVDMGTLLQATLAGQGPDVALGVGNDVPMNYGLRNAAQDLTQFGDLESLNDDFYKSAWVPYTYDGAVYALPETMSYPIMFYRKDILSELGIKPPNTWDELKVDLSILSNNQMDLGMLPGENIFSLLLYQNGGQYYRNNGAASDLDTEVAINTFKKYCSFYSHYTLDRETSATNRFRTGEAPIIIADYTTYNVLMASAPDIKGLWGFTTVPGTIREDGTIDKTVTGNGTATIMMNGTKDKEAAWEFMKWWVSEDTQSSYGRELEGIMGTAARYATANIKAMHSLPWTVREYNTLAEQMKTLVGIPQVPGGYFTWRNVNNAFYKTVVSKTMDPREALSEYVRYINDEIDYKRTEFDLPLVEH